jgi:N-acetylglucosamine-6-phosphate deacetylase
MRLGVSAAIVDGQLVNGDLEITDGAISAVLPPASGQRIAIPGLIDLQVNGFAGVDFMTADHDGHREAARALLRTGTTAYLPTIVSAPARDMVQAIRSVGAWQAARGTRGREASSFAEPCGVHVEGPFLSPVRRGVHPLEVLRQPDWELALRFLDAGPVRIVTLAPELPGALDLIQKLVGRGVIVSCGHTDATAEEAAAGFARGASTVTHLFNGMRPLHHREPGIVGAALTRDDVTIQMIVDHTHLAPEVEKLVWQATRGRLAVVTDAVPPAGLPDGTYTLGPTVITVAGGVPRGPDGQLSGGTGALLASAQRLMAFGCGLVEAVSTVTEVPARLLRRRDGGRLGVGAPADVLIVNSDLSLVSVFKDGVPLD